jgi:hypothetical protein
VLTLDSILKMLTKAKRVEIFIIRLNIASIKSSN